MSATTAKGFPYILATDNVADYPATSLALANALEAMVLAAQQVGMTTATVASGANSGTQAVTFTAGRFAVAPLVVATCQFPTGAYYPTLTGRTTTTGFTFTVINRDAAATAGSATTIEVAWHALQALVGAAPGLAALAVAGPGETVKVATCHTSGCPNEGEAMALLVSDGSDPERPTPTGYTCGVCGEPITDVQDGG